MKLATTVVQWIIRLTGLIQIVLGILIWTGVATGLIGIHTLDGLLFVVALIIMSILAAVARVQPGLVVAGIVWALIVVALGLTQDRILPGSAHWVIQVLHLLFGLGAIALGERLAQNTHARLGAPALAR